VSVGVQFGTDKNVEKYPGESFDWNNCLQQCIAKMPATEQILSAFGILLYFSKAA
jgi:hypothetical protein